MGPLLNAAGSCGGVLLRIEMQICLLKQQSKCLSGLLLKLSAKSSNEAITLVVERLLPGVAQVRVGALDLLELFHSGCRIVILVRVRMIFFSELSIRLFCWGKCVFNFDIEIL